jgi:hypothetical protein
VDRAADVDRAQAAVLCTIRRVIAMALTSVAACGGRLTSHQATGASMPNVSLADDSGLTRDDGSEPVDGSASYRTGPNDDARSPMANTLFPSACSAYASLMARRSCENCIREANLKRCSWTQLETQCQPSYECVYQSGCFGAVDACSCMAGCLPVQDNACTQLWAEAMQCVASFCAGGC